MNIDTIAQTLLATAETANDRYRRTGYDTDHDAYVTAEDAYRDYMGIPRAWHVRRGCTGTYR